MIIRTKSKIVFSSLIVILLCSLSGLLSGMSWFFDLFNHYRPQALLSAACLLVIALLIKDKGCIFLALIIAVLNGALMGERLYAFPSSAPLVQISQSDANTQRISVLFSNVLTSNTQHQSLLDAVFRNHPDILVTTEVNETWTNALDALRATYPHVVTFPQADNFGMAIYSKLPFTSEQYEVGDYQPLLLVLDFGSFTVIAAHPVPPMSPEDKEGLHVYMSKIAEVVGNTQKPVVLVGDFNATLWSSAINDLRGLNLMRTNPYGFAWTWPSKFWPLAVQLDHIFVRDVVRADFEVLSDIGSDHFPVKSTITLARSPSTIRE